MHVFFCHTYSLYYFTKHSYSHTFPKCVCGLMQDLFGLSIRHVTQMPIKEMMSMWQSFTWHPVCWRPRHAAALSCTPKMYFWPEVPYDMWILSLLWLSIGVVCWSSYLPFTNIRIIFQADTYPLVSDKHVQDHRCQLQENSPHGLAYSPLFLLGFACQCICSVSFRCQTGLLDEHPYLHISPCFTW